MFELHACLDMKRYFRIVGRQELIQLLISF